MLSAQYQCRNTSIIKMIMQGVLKEKKKKPETTVDCIAII